MNINKTKNKKKLNKLSKIENKQDIEDFLKLQKTGFSRIFVNDEILKRWMNNAKQQAVDLAKQTIEDFKGMASAGVKEASKGCFEQFLVQIVIGVVFTIIFILYIKKTLYF